MKSNWLSRWVFWKLVDWMRILKIGHLKATDKKGNITEIDFRKQTIITGRNHPNGKEKR